MDPTTRQPRTGKPAGRFVAPALACGHSVIAVEPDLHMHRRLTEGVSGMGQKEQDSVSCVHSPFVTFDPGQDVADHRHDRHAQLCRSAGEARRVPRSCVRSPRAGRRIRLRHWLVVQPQGFTPTVAQFYLGADTLGNGLTTHENTAVARFHTASAHCALSSPLEATARAACCNSLNQTDLPNHKATAGMQSPSNHASWSFLA